MYQHGMIAPVVALVMWTLIMLVWMFATRIPAMAKSGKKPGDMTKAEVQALPSAKVADNYAHLMEQPTIFYAICFALQLLGQTSDINIGLAWLYVALRIAHSLVQATINVVALRFLIFIASTVVLVMLTVHAVLQVFG